MKKKKARKKYRTRSPKPGDLILHPRDKLKLCIIIDSVKNIGTPFWDLKVMSRDQAGDVLLEDITTSKKSITGVQNSGQCCIIKPWRH